MSDPGLCIGRYQVERKLSEGGMAEVFLARTRHVAGFDKRVVVKSLLPGLNQESFSRMLVNEARIAASLDHGNIVQVVDLVEDAGRHFIVMEYLDGQNGRQLVRRALDLGRRIPPGVACRIVADVLGGLAYAHDLRDDEGRSLGLIHRDVSLANIVVTYYGGVKLIDFGVAKLTSAGDPQLTRAGEIKGKCAYMSPEQIKSQPLDRRTDIFSAGVVLWELLTQRRCFSRKTDLDTLRAICDGDAAPPSTQVPELPSRLDEIVLRALARDREARYQTADEMRTALEELMVEQSWAASTLAVQREMVSMFRSETSSNLATPPPAQTVVLDDEELEPVVEVSAPAPSPPPSPILPQLMSLGAAEEFLSTNPDVTRPVPPQARANDSAEIALLMQHTEGSSVYDTWPVPESTASGDEAQLGRGLLFAAVLVLVATAVLVAMVWLMPKGTFASLFH